MPRNNKTTPSLTDLEQATNPVETPGIMPAPGVKARVRTTIDYDRVVEPDDVQPRNYSNELRELAGQEIDEDDLPTPAPLDPYSEFVHTWRKFIGYPLKIVRLPDPADKRMPGNTYNKPCFELTLLSDTPFDPTNLIGMLQVINNNSGGVFRIFLTDEYGTPIPGARLDRLVIADPPKQYNQPQSRTYGPEDFDDRRDYYRRRQAEHEQPPAPPEKSENERFMEQLQRDLFQKTVMKALEPPPPPPVVDPMSSLPLDTRLALGLMEKGDILENVVARISSLAQAPDKMESSTWKDKLADAAVNTVTQNPQIIATVADLASRTLLMITQAFTPRSNQIASEPIPVTAQPVQHPPAQRANAQLRTTPPSQPVISNNEPNNIDEVDQEELEIDMLEDLTRLLLSEKPLSFDDPVIIDLRDTYPQMFEMALAGILKTPSMMVIQYICSKSEFAADMFNSSVTGPHLKKRLEELKALIASTIPPANTNAEQETTAPEAPTGAQG